MKILRLLLLFLPFYLLTGFNLLGQTQYVKGKIIEVISGTPVPDLKVQLKNNPVQTHSNQMGEFVLEVNDSLKSVEFGEFPGMEILEIRQVDKNNFVIYLSKLELNELSLEELINIQVKVASSQENSIFLTPSTVSIIDRDMLEKYNFLSIAEMLRTAVGIDIYQTNNDNNVATSRGILQNYYANKILVMIENIPTYQPIYGNTNLDRLDVNDVERIEVLKGPASVLYGSNAYLGVVNIILRKTKSGDLNVRLGSGYHRFGTAGANVTYSKYNFNLFISGNNSFEIQKPYELEGKKQDVFNGSNTFLFQREIKSSNFNILTGYKSLKFLLNRYEYQHTFLGINPSFISGGGKPMTDRGALAAVTFNKKMGEKTSLLADVAYDYFKRNYASNEYGSTELVLQGERLASRVKANYNLSKVFDLETGVDLERRFNAKHLTVDVLTDEVIKPNMKNVQGITEFSAFAQLQLNTKAVKLLNGLRYTNNSVGGNNFSGRISAITNLDKFNSVKLIWGQSYRAPTMLELFFDHPTVIGNINLEPEKANSLELAYVHGKNHFFIQMLGYYHKLQHLIVRFTPETGPPSQYQNVHSFKGGGFELETKYKNPEIIDLFFNYNYMSGIGEEAKINYQHVPKHTLKFGANKNVHSFFVSTNGYIVSSVMGNPRLNIPIDPQFLLDAHFGYKHNLYERKMVIAHALSAKNLTNSQMLIPEYIRQTDNINSQATTGFGRRFIYTLNISF